MLLNNLYNDCLVNEKGRTILKKLCDLVGAYELKKSIEDITSQSSKTESYELSKTLSSLVKTKIEKILGNYNLITFLIELIDISIPGLGEQIRLVTNDEVELSYAAKNLEYHGKLRKNFQNIRSQKTGDSKIIRKGFIDFVNSKSDEELRELLDLILTNGELYRLFVEEIIDETGEQYKKRYEKIKEVINRVISTPAQESKNGTKQNHNKKMSTKQKKSNLFKVMLIILLFTIIVIIIAISLTKNKSASPQSQLSGTTTIDTPTETATPVKTSVEATDLKQEKLGD